MKRSISKLIVLIGIAGAFGVKAETYHKVQVIGLKPVENMYASFEIITPKYEKVILDCQSLINGMRFYKDNKVIHEITMVNYGTCDSIYDFIAQSFQDKKAVCMELEEGNALNLSNDEATDCQ